MYKQQTQGKHINFDEKTQGKMGGNHSGKNDVENSVRTLLSFLGKQLTFLMFETRLSKKNPILE